MPRPFMSVQFPFLFGDDILGVQKSLVDWWKPGRGEWGMDCRKRKWGRRIGWSLLGVGIAALAFLGVMTWMLRIQVRTYVGVVHHDLGWISRGLEEYRQAHGTWPPHVPLTQFTTEYGTLRRAGGDQISTIAPGTSELPDLTTPIAYLVNLPSDRMSPLRGAPNAYWSNGTQYVLYSPGVDWTYDIQPLRDLAGVTSVTRFAELLRDRTYDPSNGTLSPGDLWYASTGETSKRK